MAQDEHRGEAPPERTPVNLLLVDDDPRNLDVLASLLSSPEYCLVRAKTAQEALLALIDGEFAVILLDIQMPGTNGFELANVIKQRKRTRNIPIIFLTAYLQEDKDILQGYEAGAVDYLTKPVNRQILTSKVNVFVELYRKNRELAALNRILENEISNRHKAEQALVQSNAELEARVAERTAELARLNQAKDDFLATLSHELRTPLNPILLLASESAGDSDVPGPIRERFDAIARNAVLEARLIDDLLDSNRIAHGKLLLEKQFVDIHLILEEALRIVLEEFKKKEISPEVALKAQQHILLGDAVRLQQIFWNVLKNAVKFSPAGGQIAIQTYSNIENGKITIKITDTGIGLTPEEINSIFNPFSQGDHAAPSGHPQFGGLGLGLAITHKLIELHSGTIKAESPGRNQGAIFTIEFPYVNAREQELQTLPTVPEIGRAKKLGLRLLLVEDHEPTRMALENLLQRRHYKVIPAGSIAEAKQICGRNVFDLVLSGIGLPDGTGYDLMSDLRDNYGLKGIALTGFGMEHDVARAKDAGFMAHLTKPVHIESLEKALATVV